jgi:probable HAF family extracellular repeat protein
MKRCVFAVMVALLVVVPSRQSLKADAALYRIQNLGTTADGAVPVIVGINGSGQVLGLVDGNRPVRNTDAGGWEYVPGFDGVNVARGINDSGDVVGYGFRFTPDFTIRAFRYTNATGVIEDIEPLPGDTMTLGLAINAAGDVVGSSNGGGVSRAFRATPGLPAEQLPSLGGDSAQACGINDAGQIVGSSTTFDGAKHAMRIDPGQPEAVEITSFDGSTGSSTACAIDADGRVGGQADESGLKRAFRFYDGTLLNLDSFGSSTSSTAAIAAGISVGSYATFDGDVRAFVHTEADGSSDLNDRIDAGTGWILSQAKAVNASGVIVGDGMFNGAPAAFRLTPIAPAPADTTPPTIGLLQVSPSAIATPNHAMVPVTISAVASDDKDPSPVCTVTGIDMSGAQPDSANVTGPLSGSVRADAGATYSFQVKCADAAGNAATGSATVTVARDTTAPVFTSLTATPSTIWPPSGQTVAVTIDASATDDSGETPVCKLGNITGPGTAPVDFDVTGANTGTVRAVGGRTYTFNALCADASNNVAWSSVDVTVPRDTTAPVISGVTATPSRVWPPTGALVAVSVAVQATDDVDAQPACGLSSITSTGVTADDFSITGPLSALVRATGGRTYTLNVRCSDAAGNSSSASTLVVVPRDTTAPSITALSATPSAIWPPNGKLVPVSVSVSATDDVDASPRCSLTSITGAPATEFAITGPFTATVRANRNSDGSTRTYALQVSCSDAAGNSSAATTFVTITKDQPVTLVYAAVKMVATVSGKTTGESDEKSGEKSGQKSEEKSGQKSGDKSGKQ